jgi:hypothetical protein
MGALDAARGGVEAGVAQYMELVEPGLLLVG